MKVKKTMRIPMNKKTIKIINKMIMIMTNMKVILVILKRMKTITTNIIKNTLVKEITIKTTNTTATEGIRASNIRNWSIKRLNNQLNMKMKIINFLIQGWVNLKTKKVVKMMSVKIVMTVTTLKMKIWEVPVIIWITLSSRIKEKHHHYKLQLKQNKQQQHQQQQGQWQNPCHSIKRSNLTWIEYQSTPHLQTSTRQMDFQKMTAQCLLT